MSSCLEVRPDVSLPTTLRQRGEGRGCDGNGTAVRICDRTCMSIRSGAHLPLRGTNHTFYFLYFPWNATLDGGEMVSILYSCGFKVILTAPLRTLHFQHAGRHASRANSHETWLIGRIRTDRYVCTNGFRQPRQSRPAVQGRRMATLDLASTRLAGIFTTLVRQSEFVAEPQVTAEKNKEGHAPSLVFFLPPMLIWLTSYRYLVLCGRQSMG
ncbi:hypothetical protein B0H67DRAFT_251153 [Lasiosphaeris hirsuta]|uniref:Uncharacterized protein n=1 Tax=Lasiosphaeris hirsuta TaxID=260670 RepID=A0AA40AHA3_9PEZI|nr:hypothetical protein B0H67DRAFT_251153 [Lasiosphaeris hirsuta]